MLFAFAFILQGEKLRHLSWVHHKAKLIQGYKTALGLCTGRHYKRTTKRGSSSFELLMPLIHLFGVSNFKIHFKNAHVLKHKCPSWAWGGKRKWKMGDCRCKGCRNWIVNLMTVGVRIFLAAAQLKLLEVSVNTVLSFLELSCSGREGAWDGKVGKDENWNVEQKRRIHFGRNGCRGVSRVCRGTTFITSQLLSEREARVKYLNSLWSLSFPESVNVL